MPKAGGNQAGRLQRLEWVDASNGTDRRGSIMYFDLQVIL